MLVNYFLPPKVPNILAAPPIAPVIAAVASAFAAAA
jgi:hypothetical protein